MQKVTREQDDRVKTQRIVHFTDSNQAQRSAYLKYVTDQGEIICENANKREFEVDVMNITNLHEL